MILGPGVLARSAGADGQAPPGTGPVHQFTAAPPQPTHPPVPEPTSAGSLSSGPLWGLHQARTFAFPELMARQGKEKMGGGNL